MPLHGADSSEPQYNLTDGKTIWGVYVGGATPHVWTRQEVTELGMHGIRATMPIVVCAIPAPGEPQWWEGDTAGYAYLEGLVREAIAWGVPGGSPLCFDVEKGLEDMIAESQQTMVAHAMVEACAQHAYKPWSYGSETWHTNTETAGMLKWLAKWPEVPPTDPVIPVGYHAWQYQSLEQIDLDLFESGREYMGVDLQAGIFGAPEVPVPVAEPKPEPAPVPPVDNEPAPVAEQEAVADAIQSQATETEKVADAPVTPTHAAEIRDLTGKIRTHLAELDDLANRLEAPKS